MRYYRQYLRKLDHHFRNRFISDISAEDIAGLQRTRQGEGLSGRHINAEVATLRAILRYYGAWAHISGRIRMLRQNADAGRAFGTDEEQRLLSAIFASRSPALHPFFLLSLDAGLRPSETRALWRSNIQARWSDGIIDEAEVMVASPRPKQGPVAWSA